MAPLSASALLGALPTLLPRPPTRSNPGFLHPTDALAGLVHAVHTALGFRYVPQQRGEALQRRLDERESVRAEQEQQVQGRDGRQRDDDTFSETTTAVEPEGDGADARPAAPQENQLEQGWNARGEDAYTFAYKHEQSQMRFTIRIGRMGSRISVMGMADVGLEGKEGHGVGLMGAMAAGGRAAPIYGTSLRLCGRVVFSLASGRLERGPACGRGIQLGRQVGGAVMRYSYVLMAILHRTRVQEFVMQYVEKIVTSLISGLRIEGYVEPYVPSALSPRVAPYATPPTGHRAVPQAPALARVAPDPARVPMLQKANQPTPPSRHTTPTTRRSARATSTRCTRACPAHSARMAGARPSGRAAGCSSGPTTRCSGAGGTTGASRVRAG